MENKSEKEKNWFLNLQNKFKIILQIEILIYKGHGLWVTIWQSWKWFNFIYKIIKNDKIKKMTILNIFFTE